MSDETAASATSGDVTPDANTYEAGAAAVARETIVRAPVALLNQGDNESYAALNNGAVFFDLAPRHVSVFTGEKAVDALNGLVSNDVVPLAVGKGVYAAALTSKGKMLADISILRTELQSFLVETSETAGREWWAMVRKYVNPRLARYNDQSASYATIGVYGPTAPAIIARLGTGGLGDQAVTDAMEAGLRAWPNWAHAAFVLSGTDVRLVRAPYLGSVAGFEILVAAAAREDVIKNLLRVGAVAGSEGLWRLAQLEGGFPVLGLDMDANTIPQEANLDEWGAISYEKGCYTGQETVARIHFRGHVNKLLRRLTSDTMVEPGASVHFNGKIVGDVRRSGTSPRFGSIAIAMVRREVPLGSEVQVGSGDNARTAEIAALPILGAITGSNAKQGTS